MLVHEGSMFSGGQGVYVSNLSRELVEIGHDVEVVAGPPYPDLADGVVLHKLPNYNYHRLLATGRRFFYGRPLLDVFRPLNLAELVTTRIGMYSVMGAFSIRAFEFVRELHQDEPFDVVHDNQVLGYGTLLIKALGLPVVATVHHPLDVDRANRVRAARSIIEQIRAVLFYPFFMQRLVLHRLDRVVAVSAAAAREVVDAFGLSEDDVNPVWNGVDTRAFYRVPEVPAEAGRILFVGDSEDRNKGFVYLLRALNALLPAAFQLVIVQRSWAKSAPGLAREHGLEGRVTFLDSLTNDQLLQEYNRAQIFVSPSLYEGFGLPAAEAAACGVPVVATTAGAFPEIVEDGVSGVLVPPGAAEPLAAAISGLLADPQRCEVMGAAGAQRVRQRFSWRKTAERMSEIYRDIAQAANGVACTATVPLALAR